MDQFDKKAADENTRLQLNGATEAIKAATERLLSALLLGGDPFDRAAAYQPLPMDLDELLRAANRLQNTLVVTAYRHNVRPEDLTQRLGLTREQFNEILAMHFRKDRKLATQWLNTSLERQG